ncbi:uncharacterized protein LOC118405592 [Branchiostoma floridae]|uniref:Uncharacterized protein LOC118405592 n=1 Tax=Branchiostoma floridae TaxID=7739 RepID=A0A9J7HMJ8_BRAFL|nr:uncharacterized protein LOC118405592 [Branchiostoma floridae]
MDLKMPLALRIRPDNLRFPDDKVTQSFRVTEKMRCGDTLAGLREMLILLACRDALTTSETYRELQWQRLISSLMPAMMTTPLSQLLRWGQRTNLCQGKECESL